MLSKTCTLHDMRQGIWDMILYLYLTFYCKMSKNVKDISKDSFFITCYNTSKTIATFLCLLSTSDDILLCSTPFGIERQLIFLLSLTFSIWYLSNSLNLDHQNILKAFLEHLSQPRLKVLPSQISRKWSILLCLEHIQSI